ncbi:glycosyltransferase [Blautia sp. HCP3S3_C4]
MRLFSIITVCLNAEKEIEGTIRSVLEQDFDNFEYWIIVNKVDR